MDWVRSGAQLLLNLSRLPSTSYRIDGLRNGGAIGIGHHVPSILNQVQDGSGHRTVEITRLFGLDDLVPCAVEDVDWTLNAWIMRLEFRGHRNEEGAFLRSRPQLFGPDR